MWSHKNRIFDLQWKIRNSYPEYLTQEDKAGHQFYLAPKQFYYSSPSVVCQILYSRKAWPGEKFSEFGKLSCSFTKNFSHMLFGNFSPPNFPTVQQLYTYTQLCSVKPDPILIFSLSSLHYIIHQVVNTVGHQDHWLIRDKSELFRDHL